MAIQHRLINSGLEKPFRKPKSISEDTALTGYSVYEISTKISDRDRFVGHTFKLATVAAMLMAIYRANKQGYAVARYSDGTELLINMALVMQSDKSIVWDDDSKQYRTIK